MSTRKCDKIPLVLVARGIILFVKILPNKQLDKEIYLGFREAVVGGVNFGEKIKKDHPLITKENHSENIDNFYQENQNELEAVKKDTEKCFADIEKPLFTELQKYFSRDFSQENYTCFLSIFDCNPRFLENKTFQVYYKRSHDLRKEVITHELTHFAFYDFCHGFGINDSQALWELSEIFNILFLNLPPLRAAIGAEEQLFYPELKEKMVMIQTIWSKNLPAEKFIKASLEFLQK